MSSDSLEDSTFCARVYIEQFQPEKVDLKDDFEYIKVKDHTFIVMNCVHMVYFFVDKRTNYTYTTLHYKAPFLVEKLNRPGGFSSVLIEFLANFCCKFSP